MLNKNLWITMGFPIRMLSNFRGIYIFTFHIKHEIHE
jgi:hypothetical protein